jgi:hypothetical protein
MKSFAMALLVLVGSTPALACSVEPASWNLKIMNMISSDQKVLEMARKIHGATSITEDAKGNTYWVSHGGCSFRVKPVLFFPKAREGYPQGCPQITGLEVSEDTYCTAHTTH